MKTVLFVPTYREGGLDVLEASIRRQTVWPDFVVVADELFEQRECVWHLIFDALEIEWWNVNAPKRDGYKRNLAANYNLAAQAAVEYGADLFISLQDYIWVQPDGVERFIDISQKCPGDLITGLTSISTDPGIYNTKLIWEGSGYGPDFNSENFHYSIFHRPYSDKPKSIGWTDVRINGIYEYYPEDHCLQILPEHWESNWAAVPVDFFRAGLRWDEEFDKGIAYENMDFAKAAVEEFDCRVIMDTRNHAISLPHKDYFAGEREEIVAFSNKNRYEEKWGQ